MQKIPETFCPAKWDELFLNLSYNYAYACCKSTPIKFVGDLKNVLKEQKDNLLAGIKDPSCDYCWKTENNNGPSYRDMYLKKFDSDTFTDYAEDNVDVKFLQLNLGNACNLQCIYCSPKYSSKWEDDVKKKKYPIVTDRFNYEILKKNKDLLDQNLNILASFKNLETVNLMGGEPLINNKFFEILDYVQADNLMFGSNLTVDRSVIDRLLSYKDKFKKITINGSIDSSDDTAEFLRYGIDTNLFYENIKYLLSHKDDKLDIAIQSLMTNISVIDLCNTIPRILDLVQNYNVRWNISYCQSPRILGFEALPESLRHDAIKNLEQLKGIKGIMGVEVIISALQNIRFSKSIFKEFDYFLKEWENRKQTKLVNYIKEQLYAETK